LSLNVAIVLASVNVIIDVLFILHFLYSEVSFFNVADDAITSSPVTSLINPFNISASDIKLFLPFSFSLELIAGFLASISKFNKIPPHKYG